MKNKICILFSLTLCLRLFGQSLNYPIKTTFEINEIIIKDSTQLKMIRDFKKLDSVFYEDDNYFVSKTCSGEWGGTIWFRNKNTGIEYFCEATCPVGVNKINGKYIVTNTLDHMGGSSEVIEIDNPDSLNVFVFPEPRGEKNGFKWGYMGDNESKSKKGVKQLVDSMGILIIASFPYNGQVFHIVTDNKSTVVAGIENNRLVTIDTISNMPIRMMREEVIRTIDNHYIIFFKTREVKGNLDIFDNKINLIQY